MQICLLQMLHSSMKTIKREHKFLCPHIIKIKDTYLFFKKHAWYSKSFCTFALDKRKCVRHIRTKSVIETWPSYQILAKFEYRKGRVATTPRLWIYTILWDNYILVLAWVAVAYPFCGQCEKPDKRIGKIQSSRFLHINLIVSRGSETWKAFLWKQKRFLAS